MATESLETERKYEAGTDTVLPSLNGLPQVDSVSVATEFRLIADYLDTSGLALLRAGITLRRRKGGDDDGWHLKLPVGRDTRIELHRPLGRSAAVPAELSRLVRAYSRGETLRTVARITTLRRQLDLLDAAGQPVAHIADDEVTAESLPAVSGEAAQRWREVEVELAGDGGRALLSAAGTRLLEAGLRRSASSAKLERALGDRLPARREAPHLTWHSPAADVLATYLRAQLGTLQAADPAVRRDQPDAVHQMRVTARRLRAALQVYGPVIGPVLTTAAAASLRAELRWLGQVLGAARDGEVLSGRIGAQLADLPPELVLGAAASVVTEHLAPRHAAARRAAIRALDSARYLSLLAALDDMLDAVGAAAGTAAALRDPVAHSYRRLRKRIRRAAELDPGPDRDAALHEARKAAKRARYAIGVLEPVAGQPARKLARRLKKIQSVLGDHQDTVVSRAALRDLAIAAAAAGDSAFTFGLLYERDAGAALALQRRTWKSWHRASRRQYRRWLR
ncbi:MAG TPA: CYTH and CHAD domain-containing protein [Streptosporangiaceae bacterium]|jgi:CHAD domain-containing protein